jgi:phosphatidylserine decarboxylase
MVRDGYIYGVSLLAVAALLCWFTGAWVWAVVPVLLAAFCLWFFRDPERVIPPGAGLIVSPGDGVVTETVAINTPDGERQRISIKKKEKKNILNSKKKKRKKNKNHRKKK